MFISCTVARYLGMSEHWSGVLVFIVGTAFCLLILSWCQHNLDDLLNCTDWYHCCSYFKGKQQLILKISFILYTYIIMPYLRRIPGSTIMVCVNKSFSIHRAWHPWDTDPPSDLLWSDRGSDWLHLLCQCPVQQWSTLPLFGPQFPRLLPWNGRCSWW